MLSNSLHQKNSLSKICPAFNLDIILEIIEASNVLINNTKKDDILIFIGQSPNYLSHIIKKYRKTFVVPFSGRVYSDEYSIPKSKNINNYSNMLNDIGITRKLFDSNNIIFIDHSHTGETPCLFAKIILRCLGYISKYSYNLHEYCEKKFNFINIVSNEQYPSWIKIPSKNYINLIGYLLMPNLVAFANESSPKNSIHKIPRSVPHYPHYRWNESPDYTTVIEGEHSIMKLILFHEFITKFEKIKLSNKNDITHHNIKILLYFKKILKDTINNEKHNLVINKNYNLKSFNTLLIDNINNILNETKFNIQPYILFIKK